MLDRAFQLNLNRPNRDPESLSEVSVRNVANARGYEDVSAARRHFIDGPLQRVDLRAPLHGLARIR